MSLGIWGARLDAHSRLSCRARLFSAFMKMEERPIDFSFDTNSIRNPAPAPELGVMAPPAICGLTTNIR